MLSDTRANRMRTVTLTALLGGVISFSVWAAPPTPVQQNGWLIYSDSHVTQQIPCATQPILLTGNHTDITLKGACRYVRVAGEHNDIDIEVGADATIEITGAHNDVTWHQTAPGARPRLLKSNTESNTFHPEQG
jgi:hypothetical protein